MEYYKIYTGEPTYKYFDEAYNMDDVMLSLDYIVNKLKQERFMVIRDIGNGQEPIIFGINDYIRIKGEMQDVSRGVEKVYRRKKS